MKSTGRHRHVAVMASVLSIAIIGAAAPGLAAAPSAPVHSWYGAPGAPDISGVWVLSLPANASASKEGWAPWQPPLKPPFADVYAKRIADPAKRSDDPVVGCQPPGMPRFITGTNGAMLIVQTPGRVTLYRDGIPVRRVWTDGRALPATKDLESFSNGNAIGHYSGSDLVTEIAGVRDQPIDSTGVPHSDALKISERFHRVDAQTLRIEVTLTDPTAYAKPMTSTVTYKALADPLWEPHEFLCKPNTDYHPEKYVR